ncbi:hypothetical protein [Acidiplasma sp.]|uniref:hypothetical protein n=1 Tax=Acidiplasma sp. TaxID=1872114 RepID=UPI003166B616
MSEDNNGNRNSIKPVPNKKLLIPDAPIKNGKTKIRGGKENEILEVNEPEINPFGIKNSKSIIKEKPKNNQNKNNAIFGKK